MARPKYHFTRKTTKRMLITPSARMNVPTPTDVRSDAALAGNTKAKRVERAKAVAKKKRLNIGAILAPNAPTGNEGRHRAVQRT